MKYYKEYLRLIGNQIEKLVQNFILSKDIGDFEYLTKASAVYSSNIEGNSINLNTFMNYELSKQKFKNGKEIEEIENLISAYNFAQENKITEKNLLTCHNILSQSLLIKSKRGKYRIGPVGIFGKNGLVYLAVEPEFIKQHVEELFEEINILISSKLSLGEVFYFASIIHLRFVHIHPFRDGNGRVARLLEKWFVAAKLGQNYWKISSEEYYKNNQQKYYETINIGVNFYELDYDKCIDFLVLLPNCLKK